MMLNYQTISLWLKTLFSHFLYSLFLSSFSLPLFLTSLTPSLFYSIASIFSFFFSTQWYCMYSKRKRNAILCSSSFNLVHYFKKKKKIIPVHCYVLILVALLRLSLFYTNDCSGSFSQKRYNTVQKRITLISLVCIIYIFLIFSKSSN